MTKTNIILFLIIAILIAYYIIIVNSKPEVIDIPPEANSVVIREPVAEIRFDTIFKNDILEKEIVKIVKVENPINSELLSKYEQAVHDNDSLKQLNLFKDAITERFYNEIFEDSIQTITVDSKVVGVLKSQSISYVTKTRQLTLKPIKMKPSIFVGGFIYTPVANETASSFGVNLSFMNKTKKQHYTLGIDNRKNIYLGINLKLF